ncbi:MAG: serine/threonine protein kinase [Aquificae bacterium]|nr:serine/threonine protein kinase [Aquificota bacterium]
MAGAIGRKGAGAKINHFESFKMEALSPLKGGAGIAILGRFKPIKKLGEGRFGKVYLVEDLKTGEVYALKESKDPLFARQLLDEAQNVLLLHHPNLVRLHHYFLSKDRKRIYLLYEYCDGGDLKAFVEKLGRPLKFGEALDVLYQVASGLAYLHDHGYVHLDVKPENVLLKREGEKEVWKLGDFGLLKTRGFSGILDVKGTVGYIAPEVFKGEIHRSSDVFSLGCLLYYMLEGHHPFKAEDPRKELALNRRGIIRFPKGLEPAFRPVFAKMVKINPFLRYRTAGELLRDLEKFRAG